MATEECTAADEPHGLSDLAAGELVVLQAKEGHLEYSLTTPSLLTHYPLTTHAVLLTTHDDIPHYDTPH